MKNHCARRMRNAFTLLELLVALALLTTAMAIIGGAFTTGIAAWRRGGEQVDGLRHGEFVADMLVASLRSSATSVDQPDRFGFVLEKGSGLYPSDSITWVTASSALLPLDTSFAAGLVRITFGIMANDDGEPAAGVYAVPHFVDPESFEGHEYILSTRIKGFACRVYDQGEEDWSDEWVHTNALPHWVEFTLYMDADEAHAPPQTLRRLVPLPLAALQQDPTAPDPQPSRLQDTGRPPIRRAPTR